MAVIGLNLFVGGGADFVYIWYQGNKNILKFVEQYSIIFCFLEEIV